MAPEMASRPAAQKKRKEPPYSTSNGRNDSGKTRPMKRNKVLEARFIMAQTSDAALKNGELDLQSFLNAREYEVKALENSMQKSKSALATRAFQQVPRDMRRRTASHNVKRIPKRLQKRGARDMKEDNTPTVNANKRKPGSSRGRIRAETAKKLGILADKKRAAKGTTNAAGITTRAARPKIRKNALNDPPKPPSKFRKRQIHKTWLPTHLWHAKRARMTEPKEPLWRMAIPLNSTEKSYRPTHRAGGSRGAVAWDMSYMSTIGLRGTIDSLKRVLLAIGISETHTNAPKGAKWRGGRRSWNGWLSRELKEQRLQIGPAVALWDIPTEEVSDSNAINVSKKSIRQVLIRIHPSAFLETWTELLRLSKLQHPNIQLEDLRFEMGSIEITGPGSTEALLGILHPYHQSKDNQESHAQAFTSLIGVTNPASLPANSILSFSIMDPRLRYPPRKIELPDHNDEEATFKLMEMLSTWPADESPASSPLFDRDLRYKATRLPSQKALNRRKTLAAPGTFPSVSERDPAIPIILLTSRVSQSAAQGSWTLLAPWKCILPFWYGLMHFPLSSGGNPRFGGLQELRQSHFEHGVPWFPADYPGTNAGYAWEVEQRKKRKQEWNKRPKGKRAEWKSLDLGGGRKGEIGLGWACDFEKVAGLSTLPDSEQRKQSTGDEPETTGDIKDKFVQNPFSQISSKTFSSLLSSPTADLPAPTELATIRLTLLTRGVATPTARIYRLPAELTSSEDSTNSTLSITSTLRQDWLSLVPAPLKKKPPPNPKAKDLRNIGKIPVSTPLPQRVHLLAKSLLQGPPLPYPKEENNMDNHPIVPNGEDLIGFVTTGEYNLAEGKGIAVGCVFAAEIIKVLRSAGLKEGKLCIVRNAGEIVGRLARWEVVCKAL